MVKCDSDSTNLEELFFQTLNAPAPVLPLVRKLLNSGSDRRSQEIRNLPPGEFRKSVDLVGALENLYPIFKLSDENILIKKYNVWSCMLKPGEPDPVAKALKGFCQIFKVPNDEELLIKAVTNTGIDGHCYGIRSRDDDRFVPDRLRTLKMYPGLRLTLLHEIRTALREWFPKAIADFLGNTDMVEIVQNEINEAERNALLNHNDRPDSFLSQLISLIGPKPVVCVGAQAMNLKRVIGDAKYLMESDWDDILSRFFNCIDLQLEKTNKNRIGLNQYLVKLVRKEIEKSKTIVALRRDILMQRLISIFAGKPIGKFAAKANDGNTARAQDLATKFSCLQRTLNESTHKSFTNWNKLLIVFFDYLDLRSETLGNNRKLFRSMSMSVMAKKSCDHLLSADLESGLLLNALINIRYFQQFSIPNTHEKLCDYNKFRDEEMAKLIKQSFERHMSVPAPNRLDDLAKFVEKLVGLLKHGKIGYSSKSDQQKVEYSRVFKALTNDET
uniref:Uncharacterized protein n=1 Tax=Spongospora subterranea TaxID=70186 RepID=A0A0H5R397_9EUKA|eukprot:CRZ08386.1 hypothetical protein [Spongospora subterranea]